MLTNPFLQQNLKYLSLKNLISKRILLTKIHIPQLNKTLKLFKEKNFTLFQVHQMLSCSHLRYVTPIFPTSQICQDTKHYTACKKPGGGRKKSNGTGKMHSAICDPTHIEIGAIPLSPKRKYI